MDDLKVKENVLDGTTWEFAKAGWWIVHIVGLVAVFWIGAVYWPF